MNAGRELDALVAEKVMGQAARRIETDNVWRRWHADDWFMGAPDLIAEIEEVKGAGGYGDYLLPHYSTDIAAAWLVVERMRGQWDEGDLTVVFWSFKDCGCSGWRVEIEACPDHDGCTAVYGVAAPTLAEAICRAALAAVGYAEPAP